MLFRSAKFFLFYGCLFLGGLSLGGPGVGSLPSALAAAPNQAQNCEEKLKLDKKLNENSFQVARQLANYFSLFGDAFIHHLHRLGKGTHWIDSGAGLALAQREYLAKSLAQSLESPVVLSADNYARQQEIFSRPPTERAFCTAVGYKWPEAESLNNETYQKLHREGFNPNTFRYLEGRYFEDIPNEELGTVDIITDLFGALAYTTRPDELLRKYFSILKENGAIYIHLNSWSPTRTQVDGVDFDKWISNLEGIQFESTGARDNSFILRRDPKVKYLRIPELELVGLMNGSPPERIFRSKFCP